MFKTLITFLAFWLLALATHASGLFKPMHSDYSMWLRVARDWQSGLALYEETYDNKQPTLFLFLRLIDWGNPRVSLYLAETLLAALGSLALCSALRRTVPACALLAPVLLIAVTGSAVTFMGGQCAEALALWFDVIALSCFVIALAGGAWWSMLAGGVSFFLMVSFRIPAILHGLAYLPLTWALFRQRGVKSALCLLSVFAAGIGLALLALFLHGQSEGYWEPFLQVFARNLQYGSLSRVPLSESVLTAARLVWELLTANAVLVVLTTMTLVVMGRQLFRLARQERLWLAVTLFWLTGTVAGIFPGGRGFEHYAHHIWAPLSILAVLWLARIANPPHLSRQLAMGIGLGVLFLTLGHDLQRFRLWQKAVAAANDRLQIIDQAARFLEEQSSPQAKMPVCVWGDWAELYWRVPRPSVSRCVMPICIAEIEPALFADWVAALVKTRPPLLVVDGTVLRPPGAAIPKYADLDSVKRVAPFQEIIDREYVELRSFAHKDIGSKLTFLIRKEKSAAVTKDCLRLATHVPPGLP
jgi:hypothetical protein